MIGIVHRRMGPLIVGLALTFASGSGALARDIKTSAQFDVSVGVIRAGVFWLEGSTSRRAYTVSGGFQTSGLIGGVTNVEIALSARGAIRNGSFQPSSYREDVSVGRRSGAITMEYETGTPTVAGQKYRDDDERTPVDPATQKGTLDPLTATFALLRRQPLNGACRLDRFQFDGERRTRIVMTTLTQDGEAWVCTGQFLRLEGYSARDLRRSGVVDVTVRYALAGDDLVATEAQFASLRGVLRLTRR